MNIMTLDCEYNQPSGKTIQIGAAVYKAHTGELIDTFEIYIDPGEPINTEITTLTGITNAHVEFGPKLIYAYEELRRLHKKHKCFMNPIVWGSGVNNDSSHIYQEALKDAIENNEDAFKNFMGFRVIDAKTLYQSLRIMDNKKVKGGLATAMKELGLEFVGKPHTALADAMNTFTVWHYLTKALNIKSVGSYTLTGYEMHLLEETMIELEKSE